MRKSPIETAVSERNNLVEIILNVALLSAGVNILVTGSTLLRVSIGVVLIVVSIYLLIRSKLFKIEEKILLDSALAYDKSENKLLEIPEYTLSRKFKRNMEAALSESSDIKAIWNNRPISEQDLLVPANNTNETTSITLTEEMFEYILLSKLSTISEDYFNSRSIEVEQYDRGELPDILLENRFIELFSKPMENRAAFQEHISGRERDDLPDHLEKGETVYAIGAGGAMFEKFTLTLPKNCEISRDGTGRVVIDSDELTLRVSATSMGFSTTIDYDVLLLDNNVEFEDISLKKMTASIDIEISYKSLFNDIEEKHKWVDKYIQEIERETSIEEYKDNMNLPQMKLTAKMTESKVEE